MHDGLDDGAQALTIESGSGSGGRGELGHDTIGFFREASRTQDKKRANRIIGVRLAATDQLGVRNIALDGFVINRQERVCALSGSLR